MYKPGREDDLAHQITRLINANGRIQYAAIKTLAEHLPEEQFLLQFRAPVLMGKSVIPVDLMARRGDRPDSPGSAPEQAHPVAAQGILGDLSQVVFPLIHKEVSQSREEVEEFTIGSSDANDLVMPDYMVSPSHATIRRTGSTFVLNDLGSVSGTQVNGADFGTQEVILCEGDEIRFGRYIFLLLAPVHFYDLLLGRLRDTYEQEPLSVSPKPPHPKGSRPPGDAKSPSPTMDASTPPLEEHAPFAAELTAEWIKTVTGAELQTQDGIPPEKIVGIMGYLPFFSVFSETELGKIASFQRWIRRYKLGEYIIREGEQSSDFFLLLMGEASVIKDGTTTPLALLTPGACFGEVSFLSGSKRISNVISNTVVIALAIDGRLLEELGGEIRLKIKERIILQLLLRLDRQNVELSKFRAMLGPHTDATNPATEIPSRSDAIREHMTPEELLKVVDEIGLFDSFTPYEKRRIVSDNAMVKEYQPDENIIRQGSRGRTLFILINGSVRVSRQGKTAILAILRRGEFFGEVSFLTSRLRTTNVTANEPVTVLVVSNTLFARLGIGIREKIKDAILLRLLKRLDAQNDEIILGRKSFRFVF
ncbi:MAG: cyclic nucleotide-binding domain-containing protein [Magnetococcales bacterium]|nr:cyclic nucleotide-binding domain-containing protein [Magnetococcales bacterium]MBF0156197.1 cyclic nucleotide-binding domain-containing protein [Magnetococcales bacterium]